MRKIPFAGIELTSQRVRGLRGTSELPGPPCTVCLKKNQDAPRPSEHPLVSHIQPEKTTLHGGQSRSCLLNREENKRKSPAAYPPTPHTARSEKLKSRDASTGATQVSVGLASVQGYLRLVD